jgi:DNA repair protein RadC
MANSTKNWQIVSEVELVYKTKVKTSERPQIEPSKETYTLLKALLL